MPKLHIFFGSQTGTAEEVAYDLAREAAKRLIPVEISAIDDFDLDKLITIPLAVFIVATTGQGEPPDNMKKFWKAIMSKNLPFSTFASLNFSVFGLGDSTYSDYNVVARKLFIRLQQLGGNDFYRKGLGDEMHDFSYEAEFHPWCEGLWVKLHEFFPLLSEIEVVEGLLPAMYEVIDGVEEAEERRSKVRVLENTKISEKYTQTRHIILENMEFAPGDTLAIHPPNCEKKVEQLMQHLSWENKVVAIRPNPNHPFNKKSPFPNSISISNLLTWYLDLHKPVSRYFITMISEFASGLHKEKLLEMSSKTLEGRNEYHRYITKEHRNALEVLWDFASIQQIPLNYFIEALSPTRPREFSIASAPNHLEILVSAVSFNTPFGRHIKGLCTDYLTRVNPGDFIFANVRYGRMLVPPLQSPVIMIATGTGLSPMRSLLIDRIRKNSGKNLLFFGTRHPAHDNYFSEEFENLNNIKKAQIFLAFSQIMMKRYVQDVIVEQADVVEELLRDGAFVLICGKSRLLGPNVRKALATCLESSLTADQAENFIKTMERSKKIYLENW